MIVVSFFLFTGFFLLYNTSKRTQLRRNPIGIWLHKNSKISKILGASLLVLGFYVLMDTSGFGSGIFLGLGLLMLIASLVILLFPLSNIKQRKK